MNAMRSPQQWMSLVCLGTCVILFQPREVPLVHAQEHSAEEGYHYQPSGKRYDFSPLHRVTETAVPDEASTPLQRLDLGQFNGGCHPGHQ